MSDVNGCPSLEQPSTVRGYLPNLFNSLKTNTHKIRAGAVAILTTVAFEASPLLTEPASASSKANVEVIETSPGLEQHLTHMPNLSFSANQAGESSDEWTIKVDDSEQYQTFQGEGAAMTDSSAWLLSTLPRAELDETMQHLFGDKPGDAHITQLRLPMGASDFTAGEKPYTYDDMPPGQTDPSLSHFSIGHDRKYIIPMLRDALRIDPKIQIEAVPWTPPPWMKSNDAYNDENRAGLLLPQYYMPFANYFVKFIKAYARAGITIDSIVPANEPTVRTAYPGVELPPNGEALFISNFLMPALKIARLQTDVFGDDLSYDKTVYASTASVKPEDESDGSGASSDGASDGDGDSVDGEIAGNSFHCYNGSPLLMTTIHADYPNLDLRMDECSPGVIPNPAAESMISAMRNYASSVLLWNIALDPQGGPVQPPDSGCHGCTGLITIDPQTHKVLYNQAAYYQLGQIGDFVRLGARRINTNDYVNDSARVTTPGLDDVGFKNPNGTHVLEVYDNSSNYIRYKVEWDGKLLGNIIKPGAMQTLEW